MPAKEPRSEKLGVQASGDLGLRAAAVLRMMCGKGRNNEGLVSSTTCRRQGWVLYVEARSSLAHR